LPTGMNRTPTIVWAGCAGAGAASSVVTGTSMLSPRNK
jgi:hypothetical protein